MNYKLYMRETVKLIRLYIKSDDYKSAFFVLLNSLLSMKQEHFEQLDCFIEKN